MLKRMMKWIILLPLALILVSQGANVHAEKEFVPGNKLQDWCEAYINGTNPSSSEHCINYIKGVIDLYSYYVDTTGLKRYWCTDEYFSEQLVWSVVQFLRKNLPEQPEWQKLDATVLVNYTFIEAFPCN